MSDYKIIHDAIHGSIKFDGVTLKLLESPEIQRLSGIKQLGLGYLVFPGANHTRLEHSIGVGYMAGRMGEMLGLPKEEVELLKAAGMLHDLGHSPFSHTLEYLLHEKTGLDHMEITVKIIKGDIDLLEDMNIEGRETIPEILDEFSLDADTISRMILGKTKEMTLESFENPRNFFGDEKNYLVNIISGSLDADQIDYLLRDAHYTGVAHGAIDVYRILNTIKIKNGELMIDKKGVPALEGMLVARALMYSAVYFHKTNRIGELMLSRAVEEIELSNWIDIYRFNDSELISLMLEQDGYPREIALRLKYRRLFKKAMVKRFEELEESYGEENYKETLLRLCDLKYRRRVEREIAESAGIDERYVLIDIPEKNVILSEPRLSKTNVKVIDGNSVYPLSKFSPLARALQTRKVQDWAIMVATPKTYVEKIQKIAERVIFS